MHLLHTLEMYKYIYYFHLFFSRHPTISDIFKPVPPSVPVSQFDFLHTICLRKMPHR